MNYGSNTRSRGFSMIEMMVVLAIMSLMMSLVAVGVSGLLTESSMDEGTTTLTECLRRARSYSIANNAYTFVGITEVNGLTSSASTPVAGNGRIAIAVYSTLDKSNGISANFSSNNVLIVCPLNTMQDLHLTSGFVYAGKPLSETTENIETVQTPTFPDGAMNWPPTGTPKYSFATVIQMNPNGSAQLLDPAFSSALCEPIEIDLQPAHGSTFNTNPQSTVGAAIIIVDGVSGDSTLYRP